MNIVIKIGGAAMDSREQVMQEVVELQKRGLHPIVVHGGGPEISRMCQRLGIVPQFLNGERVTDEATLEVAEMVLVGKMNTTLVAALNGYGGVAVGLSGHDGRLFVARKKVGFVGEIEQVNVVVLETLKGYIPVISPIAAGHDGQSLNVNADLVAAEIAKAVKAEHLIFLTDTAGVFKEGKLVKVLDDRSVPEMIACGELSGGMIPKIQGAVTALAGGVGHVHILNGDILGHVLGGEHAGTKIVLAGK